MYHVIYLEQRNLEEKEQDNPFWSDDDTNSGKKIRHESEGNFLLVTLTLLTIHIISSFGKLLYIIFQLQTDWVVMRQMVNQDQKKVCKFVTFRLEWHRKFDVQEITYCQQTYIADNATTLHRFYFHLFGPFASCTNNCSLGRANVQFIIVGEGQIHWLNDEEDITDMPDENQEDWKKYIDLESGGQCVLITVGGYFIDISLLYNVSQ